MPSNVIPLTRPPSPPVERPDDELMLVARAGVSEALATLVGRHTGRLMSYCAKLLGDRALADEITQEVWLRIWAHRAAYRPEGKFVVLLYTTARNLCKNHGRAGRRRAHWLPMAKPSEAIDAVSDGRADHLTVLLERERQRDVHRALGALPEAMREALLLRFEEELAYEDIAAIVGANEATVRSRVHHGLKQLRRKLEKGER